MRAKFKDRLSVKVVLLTLVMACMILLASIIGITSLSEFKKEYQLIKNENFTFLLKMTELKAQTDGLVHLSSEMLLADTVNELEWDMLEISDKRVTVDNLLAELAEHTEDHQKLLMLKLRLYSLLNDIQHVVSEKFSYSETFYKLYTDAQALKIEILKKGDTKFYKLLENVLRHFDPIINKQIKKSREADLNVLNRYIKSSRLDISEQQSQHLQALFYGRNSLPIIYDAYAKQLQSIEVLRGKNEEFADLTVSFIGQNVTRIQDHFLDKLTLLDSKISKRKWHLYIVVFTCLLVTIFLILIQLNFIRRIELIRKVINAGETDRNMLFPINGKDEISHMAVSVKSYIERLVVKEQEVLAINKQLAHLSTHDNLTNIFNRRYFETLLEQENRRYQRYKEIYCLAMIDLDMFKKINDEFGHDAGDNVLIEFTKCVLEVIRNADVFARYGGEEFVLLMPNTVKNNAHMLMERIRTEIEKTACQYNEQMISFTVSIGLVGVRGLGEEDAFKQLSCADEALSKAKRTGRNKVCVYGN